MKQVVVVTGGGSGMGLATIKYMSKEKTYIISGRTEAKLQKACEELKAEGYEALYKTCDTSKRESVKELVQYAQSVGEITNVIHAAGVSPAMNVTPESIIRINAMGTVYINTEFSKVMKKGTVIVDISSMSAYVLPEMIIPKKAYLLAETDEDTFVKKLIKRASIAKEGYQRNGFAYSLSKNFVVWYAQKSAFEYGPKGIRVVSLSPGLIATDMGNLEKDAGGEMLKFSAEERMGKPEELGYAIATLADERNGYLAGVDILCDGGTIIGQNIFKKNKK